MPFPVYSTKFIASAGVTTSVVYNAPPGFRMVLRNMTFTFGGVSGFLTASYGAGPVFYRVNNVGTYPNNSYQWEGHLVFNAGDSLRVDSSGTSVDVCASGYLLTLP